jgi:hypothetical protein
MKRNFFRHRLSSSPVWIVEADSTVVEAAVLQCVHTAAGHGAIFKFTLKQNRRINQMLLRLLFLYL